MRCQVVSAVALYGPKPAPLAGFLGGLQDAVAERLGDGFRPYTLDQIHATLIWLNGLPDAGTGVIVNQRRLERTGERRPMDLGRATRILAEHLARPVPIRVGGFGPGDDVWFRSRGQHPHQRAFSAQAGAFVLVGWPVAAVAGRDRPLDRLRRAMSAAGVFHRYHEGDHDVDEDLHLVIGHHQRAPGAGAAVRAAVGAVRGRLAAEPFEFAIGADDVRIVASDSLTLSPAHFVGGLGTDEATLRSLMS